MKIRAAEVSDAYALAVAHVRSWQSAYQGLLPQPYLDSLDPQQRHRGWERVLSATEWPRAGTWLAETPDGLTGFISFSPSRDQDKDPLTVGEITSIYVVPEVWGTGTGRRLMAAAVQSLAAAGFDQAALWVLNTNDRARRFYEAASWHVDGATKQDQTRGFPLTEVRYVRHSPVARPAPGSTDAPHR